MTTSLLSFRHQYDVERDRIEDLKSMVDDFEESITIQDNGDSDLNVIMKRFGINDGSQLPAELGITDPRYYGDFTESPEDLRQVLDTFREAEERFNQLPPKLRERFNNRPLQLMEFIQNPENLDEAVKLKLLHRDAIPAPAEPAPTPAPTPVDK